jgi:hypothetical protein
VYLITHRLRVECLKTVVGLQPVFSLFTNDLVDLFGDELSMKFFAVDLSYMLGSAFGTKKCCVQSVNSTF